MNDNFNLGERLKKLRLEKNLSQEQIANMSNITTAYFGQVERGTKNVTVKTLEKICKALDISLAEFFHIQSSESFKDIDDVCSKILYQLVGKSEAEKQIILNLIKLVFSIKSV